MTKFLVVLAALAAVALAQSTGNTTHVSTGNTTAVSTGNTTTTTTSTTTTSSSSSSAAATTEHPSPATSSTSSSSVGTTQQPSLATSTSSSGAATTQQPSLATGSTSSSSTSAPVAATTGMPAAYAVTVQAWTDMGNETCSGPNGTATVTMFDNLCMPFSEGVFGPFNGTARGHFFNNTVALSVYGSNDCVAAQLASGVFTNGRCEPVAFSGYASKFLTISWGASTSSSSSSSSSSGGSGSGSGSTTGDVGAGSALVPSLLAMLLASVFFFAL